MFKKKDYTSNPAKTGKDNKALWSELLLGNWYLTASLPKQKHQNLENSYTNDNVKKLMSLDFRVKVHFTAFFLKQKMKKWRSYGKKRFFQEGVDLIYPRLYPQYPMDL